MSKIFDPGRQPCGWEGCRRGDAVVAGDVYRRVRGPGSVPRRTAFLGRTALCRSLRPQMLFEWRHSLAPYIFSSDTRHALLVTLPLRRARPCKIVKYIRRRLPYLSLPRDMTSFIQGQAVEHLWYTSIPYQLPNQDHWL